MTQSKLHQMNYFRELLLKWRRRALTKVYSFSDPSVRTDDKAGAMDKRRSISMPLLPDGGRRRGVNSTRKVQAGHLAVYVDEERKRFVVKMSYLSHPLFRALLKRTEEEIGFQSDGPLVLACGVAAFEKLLCIIQSSCKAQNCQRSMRGNVSAEDEQHHEKLLQELLESAEALAMAAYPRRETSSSHTLSQAVVA